MIEHIEPSPHLDIAATRSFLVALEREQEKIGWSGNKLAPVVGLSHARVYARIARLKKFGVLIPLPREEKRQPERYRVNWLRFEQIEQRHAKA